MIYLSLTFGIFEGEDETKGCVGVFPNPDGVGQLGQEALVGRHEVVSDRLQVGAPVLGLSSIFQLPNKASIKRVFAQFDS